MYWIYSVTTSLDPGTVSAPYHQHQNPAELRYETVTCVINTLMDRTGTSAALCFFVSHTCVFFSTIQLSSLENGTHPCSLPLVPMTSACYFVSSGCNLFTTKYSRHRVLSQVMSLNKAAILCNCRFVSKDIVYRR